MKFMESVVLYQIRLAEETAIVAFRFWCFSQRKSELIRESPGKSGILRYGLP